MISRVSARGGRTGRSFTLAIVSPAIGSHGFTAEAAERGCLIQWRASMARLAPHSPAQRSVLMIGSEALPFSKTGGLADVLGALPVALARLGWQVTLVVPRYRGVTAGVEVGRLRLDVGGYHTEVGLFEEALPGGVRVLLVDEPRLYDRESYYAVNGQDYPDNPRR